MSKNSLLFYEDNDKMYGDLMKEREETLKSQYMNNNPNEIG